MELNWSTFTFEVVNFLVLVWILKRFLYQPVLKAIEQRRAQIEGKLAEAHSTQAEAHQLRAQYQNRLADWEQEKSEAREQLQAELETARRRRLEDLKRELEAEREKSRVRAERRESERLRECELGAVDLGATLASKLLRRFSGPDVDERVQQLVLEELDELPEERRHALRRAFEANHGRVEVVSAHQLSDSRRTHIERVINALLGAEPEYVYGEDPALVAGLRITLGPWALGANFADELKGFVHAAAEPD